MNTDHHRRNLILHIDNDVNRFQWVGHTGIRLHMDGGRDVRVGVGGESEVWDDVTLARVRRVRWVEERREVDVRPVRVKKVRWVEGRGERWVGVGEG